MIPDVNVKDLEKNATVLLDWIIKPLPNVRGLCVEGQKEGLADFWHSTEIIRDVRPKLVMTVRGSVYKLKGKINKLCTIDNGFSKEIADLFSNGFPKNWKEIIGRFYQQLEKSISIYEVSRTSPRKEKRVTKKASVLSQSANTRKKSANSSKMSASTSKISANTSKMSANTSKMSANTSRSEQAVALLDKHPAECTAPTPAEVWTPCGLMKQQLAPSEVTVTKSGRLSLRPLAYWAGQHYRYMSDSGVIEVTFDTNHAKHLMKDAVLGVAKEKKPAGLNSDSKKQNSKVRSSTEQQLVPPEECKTPSGLSKHVRTLSLTRVRTLSLTWNTSSRTAPQASDIVTSMNKKAPNSSAKCKSPKKGRLRPRKYGTGQPGSAPQPLVDVRKPVQAITASPAIQAREANSTQARTSRTSSRSRDYSLSEKNISEKKLCKSEIKIVLKRCSSDSHRTRRKSTNNVHETAVSQVSDDDDEVRPSKLINDPLKGGTHASKACLPSQKSTRRNTPPDSQFVRKTKVQADGSQTEAKSLKKSLTGIYPSDDSASVRKGDSSHQQQKLLKPPLLQNNRNPLENNLNPIEKSVNLRQNNLIPKQNTFLPPLEKRGRKRKSENQQPDAEIDVGKKKKADPERNVAWNQKEQDSLKRALEEVDVTLADYWLQVSLVVGTRSELECQEFYKSSLEGITKKTKRKLPAAKEKPKPKEARLKGEAIRGGKGTLKRKKDLRAFLDEQNEGYEDNIFDCSLFMRQKKTMPSVFTVNVDKTDEEIFGSNPNCITPVANKTTVSTPGTELRAKIVSVRKTPSNVLTAAIEETPTSINRNKVDQYIRSFMDRKKKSLTTRGHTSEQVEVSKQPDTDPELAISQLQQTLPIKSLFSPASNRPSILVDSVDLEEESGPFTYYWNDDD